MRQLIKNMMQGQNRFTSLFTGLAMLLVSGMPSVTLATQSVTYYHWDALGSPVAASDETGNVKWREQYQPYGERIQNQTAAQSNDRWFTGHPHDNATGLTYMGARWYDPAVGRFMGSDPVAFTEANIHSFSRYAYSNNNPYKYIDPNGEFAIDLNLGLIGGTVGTDEGSGQPFWKFRLGPTGVGLFVYPSYDFSTTSHDNLVGDCSACDVRAESSGYNVSLGVSGGAGIVSFQGNAVEKSKQVVNVEHSNGGISTDVDARPARYFTGDAKIGWSGNENANNKTKSRYGINISADANAEWGGLVPWSDFPWSGASSRRDPNF